MADLLQVPQALLTEAVAELERTKNWQAQRGLLHLLSPCDHDAIARAQCAARELLCGDDQQPLEHLQDLWIGGERPLVFFASEGLEACGLCVLHAFSADASPLRLGADDVDGFTALHYAANLGQRRLAAALVRHGANLHAATRDVSGLNEPGGRTALHFAASSGQLSIAMDLLDARSDANQQDWTGCTPFVLACRRGQFSLARALAERSGEAFEAPSEQELSGLEMIEGMAVRERTRQRRCIDERPEVHKAFILKDLWDASWCRTLLDDVERTTNVVGWTSKRHRHHPTVDIPAKMISPQMYAQVRRALDEKVLPEMQRHWNTIALRIREAFFVKYEALDDSAVAGVPRQAGLGMHRDGTLLNCVIVLNDTSEFEGGGTVFAPPVDKTYRPPQGDCLCSCGQLEHGANPVTKGTRYVLVAFIDEAIEYESDDESE